MQRAADIPWERIGKIETLGLSAGAADAYAASVVAADFDAPGDGDVLGKVETDFAAQRIAVAESELHAAFTAAAAEARRQIASH